MESISRQSWIRVISNLLSAYRNGHEPFTSATLFNPDLPPGENTALLAKIDLERAFEAGYKTPAAIVEFLGICEEGWFFEADARFYELLQECSEK